MVGLVGDLSRLCVTRVAVGDASFAGCAAGLAADRYAVLRSLEALVGGGDALTRRIDGQLGEVQNMEDVVYDFSVQGVMLLGGGG